MLKRTKFRFPVQTYMRRLAFGGTLLAAGRCELHGTCRRMRRIEGASAV